MDLFFLFIYFFFLQPNYANGILAFSKKKKTDDLMQISKPWHSKRKGGSVIQLCYLNVAPL